MAQALADILDTTIHKTIIWFDELDTLFGWNNPPKTYSVFRAILHVLRDRLPVSEAADLGAQLPMLIRGLYYEGWRPIDKPLKLQTRQEFLQAVCDRFRGNCDFDPEKAVKAVFRFLTEKITQGEIEDVRQNMPKDIRDWWS